MDTITMILSIILFVVSLGLIAVVSVQTDRSSRSTAISGSAGQGFYGKNKGNTKEMFFKRVTIITAIVFVALVVVVNILEII